MNKSIHFNPTIKHSGGYEGDHWSGNCLLDKLTDTVHLSITSHEHPNLQFSLDSQFNRVGIHFDCHY